MLNSFTGYLAVLVVCIAPQVLVQRMALIEYQLDR